MRARGRASEIQKKTSHITIVLDEIKEKTRKAKRAKKARPEPAEGVEKAKKAVEKARKEKPKFKPELEIKKPKVGKGIKRIFRRKAF